MLFSMNRRKTEGRRTESLNDGCSKCQVLNIPQKFLQAWPYRRDASKALMIKPPGSWGQVEGHGWMMVVPNIKYSSRVPPPKYLTSKASASAEFQRYCTSNAGKTGGRRRSVCGSAKRVHNLQLDRSKKNYQEPKVGKAFLRSLSIPETCRRDNKKDPSDNHSLVCIISAPRR